MKLGFLFSGVFWGLLLIFFGVSAILRSFDIYIPFFRIAFALIIIYLGLALLLGGPVFETQKDTILFSESEIKVTENVQNEYNLIFGRGYIDLTGINPAEINHSIEINTIFSSGTVKLNPEHPVIIEVDAAFASASLPDGNKVTFGDYTYRSPEGTADEIPLKIEASAVFGDLKFITE